MMRIFCGYENELEFFWCCGLGQDTQVNCDQSFGEFCTNAAMDSKVLAQCEGISCLTLHSITDCEQCSKKC